MLIGFILNASVLVALSVVSSLLGERFGGKDRSGPWVQGVLYGATSVLVMMAPVWLQDGVMFDGRTVILSLGAWFFGPVTALVSAGLALAYRMDLGGAGMPVGMASILIAAGAGLLARRRFPPDRGLPNLQQLYLFGLGLHALLCLLFVAYFTLETAWPVLSLYVLAYPLATVLAGEVLVHQLREDQILSTLQLRDEQLRLITESMRDVLWIFDLKTQRFHYVSPSSVHHTGYASEEAMNLSLAETLTPESLVLVSQWLQEDVRSLAGLDKASPEKAHPIRRIQERHKNGGTVWSEISVSVLCGEDGEPDRVVGVSRNIEDQVARENQLRESEAKYRDLLAVSLEVGARLQHSLEEKEVLFKEVHHRVKNNLQVISSLLSLEAGRVEQPETRGVLVGMQRRIRAMSLLHEAVYHTEHLDRVDMGNYLRQLVRFVEQTVSDTSGRVSIDLEVAEVVLDLDRAITCGLLVNELLGNAFKHGFPGQRLGKIHVGLQSDATLGSHVLEVQNDGEPLPQGFDPAGSTSLGMNLISDFARQLGGNFQALPGPPVTMRVTFPIFMDTPPA